MPALTTTWLGLELANPLVVGAGPLTNDLASLVDLEKAGAAAVVLPSLFEEQIEHDEMEAHTLFEQYADLAPDTSSYLPELEGYNDGPERYLEHLRVARETLSIPVVASLNGHSPGSWVRWAKAMEDNGAHAIELNIYYVPVDPDENAIAVEDRYLEIVAAVRSQVSIPMSVKTGASFSSIPHMVKKFGEAGADGVVMFNRLLHPDIDLEELTVEPVLELSSRAEMRERLRWIAVVKDRVPVSIAATGGTESAEDVVKLLIVGADVVQIVSSVLRNGPEHLGTLRDGMRDWMREMGYESVEQLKGSACRGRTANPEAFERANYLKSLVTFTDRLKS